MPNFALGPVLILVFSIELGWLPVSGRGGISHLILPAATLGAALAAILTRMVRGSMIEELGSDYVRTARPKDYAGARRAVPSRISQRARAHRHDSRIAIRHAAGRHNRHRVHFSWPGIGRLTVQAIQARDYPLLQGCILVIALSYVVVNLLTDVVYSLIDPRIRVS